MEIPRYVISQLANWSKEKKYGYIQVHFKEGRMTHLIRYESSLVTQAKSHGVDSQVVKTEAGSAITENADYKVKGAINA